MITYKATIVDDDSMDLLVLQKLISTYCINIEIINQVQSIDDAIIEIEKNRPDIVFLDIMYKNLIIFDFLDKFDLQGIQVIFVTSEKKFALNAFETGAVDFILKPLNIENVILAINKAVKQIKIKNCCAINNCVIKTINRNPTSNTDYLAVSSLDKIDFLKMSDIVFCMADGKYTTFFLSDGKKYLSCKNIGEYEKLLDNSYFYRVHHSYLINIKFLTRVIKKDGSYCELFNGVTIPLAKRRQDGFNRFIKIKD